MEIQRYELKSKEEKITVLKHCSAWFSLKELNEVFDFGLSTSGIYKVIRDNNYLNHKTASQARENEALWQLKDHEDRQRTISLELALEDIGIYQEDIE